MICEAPAKINLALHVTGERNDGYHEIDTLVAFATIGDRIVIKETSTQTASMTFEAAGPFSSMLGEHSDNLVLRAARKFEAMADKTANRSFHLKLEKNLPVASGIGGGSADAAATLLGLASFLGPEETFDLGPIAKKLGSDVTMCLISRMLRATGTGTEVQALESTKQFPAVLVNPQFALSTPAVFGALEKKVNPGMEFGDELLDAELLADLRNDLETPAITLVPKIADVLQLIADCPGCVLSRMSGSGATCFGIFDSVKAAHSAAEIVRKNRPDWWCAETELGSYDAERRIRVVQHEADKYE